VLWKRTFVIVEISGEEGVMRESMPTVVMPPADGLTQAHRHARRHPWIAGCLSFNAAGVGQLYNGQPAKGLLLYGLGWGVLLAALAMLLGLPTAPWNVVIPALMVMS
jgi:hypothetical protein